MSKQERQQVNSENLIHTNILTLPVHPLHNLVNPFYWMCKIIVNYNKARDTNQEEALIGCELHIYRVKLIEQLYTKSK